MNTSLRKVENLVTIPVAKATIFDESEGPTLAPRLLRDLRNSPPPERDEWGLRPHSLIWVLFHPEGEEPRLVASEEAEDYSQWLNAFSIISPRSSFLAEWEQELKNQLKVLFAGNELREQKRFLLYRISTS